jgi:YidC/Oxa1 family membrane protein insertase
MIGLILREIFFRPIFNLLLVFVFITGGSLGWGIVLLTIFIKLLLLKPTLATNDIQKHMTDLQPKIEEIKEKYKDDPQKMNEEMMKLFQSNASNLK